MAKRKIVVAYSGGLDTSVMVKWLSEKYNADIITATADLGQSKEIVGVEEKAKQTGAVKAYVLDLREEFITKYVWKALKAGALYEGTYPMATAIGRPLLAKMLVDIAIKENADSVSHGCTGKGNDQVRFEVGINTLAPQLNVIAPLREWEFKSREEEIDYAVKHNIPINATKSSPYSTDENLWGISVECGILEDPEAAPPEDAYQVTKNPKETSDKGEIISIGFEKGVPVSLNGIEFNAVELVSQLRNIGAEHGVGRLDLIENRVVGIKSREIYEAPAAVILHHAHSELERMILDKETFRFKQEVSIKYANLIYDGLWFSPLFNSLTAFVDATQEYVTGEVKLELYKGSIKTLARKSPYSLYRKDLATYTTEDTFDHQASVGFIKLFGLPYKTITQVYNGIKDEVNA
ncbi:MAG: argininosuccinate synthase [Ignavibacteriaceae bacterium]